jgi:4-amino-4-deoxy-L-arabinose transferase-like glycosyltransferase
MSMTVLESKSTLWLIAVLAVFFFSITNMPWQLDEYSQDRQALTSFSMIRDGRWFYQPAPRTLRSEKFATKPPLIGWLSAGLFATTGSWDMAWRLPSFLAAIALAILLFRAAAFAFGAAGGLLALAAFSLNMITPRMATLVRTDMPLALVVFLLGLQIWQKIRRREAWTTRDRWITFALITLGLYIKGPIVYVFLLPGIGAFQWLERKERAANAGCGWWPWVAPLGVFLLWVIGGIVSQPGFFDQVVMHEFLGRLGSTEQRPHPPYFYIGHLLQKFAPWSEFLIGLAALGVLSTRGSIRAGFQKLSPDTLWLICWSLGGLIVLSIVPSKRIDRIFPMIPAFCLLLAGLIAGSFANQRQRLYRWSAVALVAAIALTSWYVISKIVSGYGNHRDTLVVFGRDVRREARANHWRYEAVTSHDGGMLLYLEKTNFVEPARAVAEWNNLDALVSEADDAPALMRDLPGAKLSGLSTKHPKGERSDGYVLITH